MSFWSRTHAAVGAFRADGGQSYTDAVFSAFDSIAGVDSIVQSTVSAFEVVAGRGRAWILIRAGRRQSAREAASLLRMYSGTLVADSSSAENRSICSRWDETAPRRSCRQSGAGRFTAMRILRHGVIGASVPTPSGTKYVRRGIGAWLFCMGSRTPWRPYRGVSALYRSRLTWALAGAAEDALLREMRIPTKAVYPLPKGQGGKEAAAGLRAGVCLQN